MTYSKTVPHKHTVQHGFSLIEVMVALLIFSIGLMGLAGLQMEGMNNNYDAMMRTIATQHAYDMTDRLRTSRGGYFVNQGGGNGNGACNLNGACTGLTQTDFDSWTNTVSNTLPGGDGEVFDVPGAPGMVEVVVRWDENGTGTTGRACPPPPYSDNLQCVRVRIIP